MARQRGPAIASAVVAAAAVVGWQVRRKLRIRSANGWSPPGGELHLGSLAYRTVGDGPARLCLLHGMFNSGQYWDARYDTLAGDGKLIVPDLLGFGRSPRPASGYTADEHADRIAAVLEEAGTPHPIVIGAHSVGGIVALRLAIRHPELVAGVVAISPPLYPGREAARRRIADTDPFARLITQREAWAERACLWMDGHRAAARLLVRLFRPGLPATLAADRVEHSWSSYRETFEQLIVSDQAPGWLTETTVPVRLVAGDSDRAVDVAFLTELSRRRSGVSLTTVPNAGHDLPLSHPLDCLSALRQMLQSVHRRDQPTT